MPGPPAPNPVLSTTLAGIPLVCPVILAAGTCGVMDEMAGVLDLSRVGALVTKSITPLARDGHPTWRMWPLGSIGMLNAIGLANPGLDGFLEHYAPRVGSVQCPVFVSVAGFSQADYVTVCANIGAYSAEHGGCFPAVELNLSCPNVQTGTEFGGEPGLCRGVVEACRAVLPSAGLFVKLSPVTHDLPAVARSALAAGADGLTLANTIPAMAIDVETRRPVLSNTTGGLSGPAVHPVTLKCVHEVFRRVVREWPSVAGKNKPALVGLGGVMKWQDAAEFVLAGASAVQIGTGLFANPRLPLKIAKGLETWVRRQGKANIGELVGAMEPAHDAAEE